MILVEANILCMPAILSIPADTLLLTRPNQLGVDYCAYGIEAILTHVAPALGWR